MKDGCSSQKVKKKRSTELPVLPNAGDPKDAIAHSTTSIWRAGALIAVNVLMIVHYVQWLIMGTTISPIEPSETMYTPQNGTINAGFILLRFAIVPTVPF